MKDSAIAIFWCEDFDINQGETSLLINISNKSGFISPKNWKQVKGFISHWIMIFTLCVEVEVSWGIYFRTNWFINDTLLLFFQL